MFDDCECEDWLYVEDCCEYFGCDVVFECEQIED